MSICQPQPQGSLNSPGPDMKRCLGRLKRNKSSTFPCGLLLPDGNLCWHCYMYFQPPIPKPQSLNSEPRAPATIESTRLADPCAKLKTQSTPQLRLSSRSKDMGTIGELTPEPSAKLDLLRFWALQLWGLCWLKLSRLQMVRPSWLLGSR